MSQAALSREAGRGTNRPAATSHMQMSPDLAENVLALDPPARRRDRDHELVGFVGRHGLVAIRHVMAELGVGRTAAYRRVATCVEAGLLERLDLLATEQVEALQPRRPALRRPRPAVREGHPRRRRSPAALRDHRAAARPPLRTRSRPRRARAGPCRADRRPRSGERRPRRTAGQDAPAPARPGGPRRRGDRSRSRSS